MEDMHAHLAGNMEIEPKVLERDKVRPWAVETRQFGAKDWDVCVFHEKLGGRTLQLRILCHTRKLAAVWHGRMVKRCRQAREVLHGKKKP